MSISYTCIGKTSDGLRWGLGNRAPIHITKNFLLSSDTYVYINEDNGKIMISDYNMKDASEYTGSPVTYIHSNSNCYRDYDGYLEKDYTDLVKICISDIKKLDVNDYYPIFKCTVTINSIPDNEEE